MNNNTSTINKSKHGVTLIELVIAMAMMAIIGIATVGLAGYIVRYYRAVSDNATAKNIAMINIDYIRNELLDAKEIEVYSTSKTSTTAIGTSDVSAILTSDGNSQLMRQSVTQGSSGHSVAASTPAIGIVTGEEGKSNVWNADITFRKPGANDAPLLEVVVEVSKSGEVINDWSTTIYMPNVEINPDAAKRVVVFPSGETEGTHIFYIKGLIN